MDRSPHDSPFAVGHDELERYALEECVKRQRVDRRTTVLTLGDRSLSSALQLAQAGAQVVAGEAPEWQQEITGRILASGQRDNITFVPTGPDRLPSAWPESPTDIIVVRRGICMMTYADAGQFIRRLLQQMKIGGKLYLSVLGLHSVLGENYPHADLPITDRFSHLSPLLAEKYVIPHAVCLYTERNLFQLLLECGMAVTRTLTTTYGNVQAVAVRI